MEAEPCGFGFFLFLQLICNLNENEGIKKKKREEKGICSQEKGAFGALGRAAAALASGHPCQGDAPVPPSHPIRADPNQPGGTGPALPALLPLFIVGLLSGMFLPWAVGNPNRIECSALEAVIYGLWLKLITLPPETCLHCAIKQLHIID